MGVTATYGTEVGINFHGHLLQIALEFKRRNLVILIVSFFILMSSILVKSSIIYKQ